MAKLQFKSPLWARLLFLSMTFVSAEWNTNDYMKREHSVVRPYQGESLLMIQPQLLGYTWNCEDIYTVCNDMFLSWRLRNFSTNTFETWDATAVFNNECLFFCTTGAGFGIPNWDFMGSTMVTSAHIRLTADTRSQQGSLWNRVVSVHRLISLSDIPVMATL